MLLEDDGRGNGYDGMSCVALTDINQRIADVVLILPFPLSPNLPLLRPRPFIPYHHGTSDDDVDAPDTIYDLDLPSSASGSPSPSGDEDEEEDDTPRLPRQFKRGRDEDLTKKGRFGHEYDPKQDVVFPSSDEDESDEDEGAGEVDERQLAGADDEDEDEGSKLRKGGADEDDEDEDPHWRADQYHVTRRDPGEADSEDEEALALEEEEVRRLQKKMREKMEGNDFGLDLGVDGVDDVAEGEKEGKRRRIEEEDETVVAAGADKAAKDALSTADMSEPEAIAHLLKTSPETLALVDDFVLTASKIKQVEADLAEVRKGDGQGGEHPALAIMELEHREPVPLAPLHTSLTPARSQRPSRPTFPPLRSTSLSSSRRLPLRKRSSRGSSPACRACAAASLRWRSST